MNRLAGSWSGRWAAVLCAGFALGCAAGYALRLPPGPWLLLDLLAVAAACMAVSLRRRTAALLLVAMALALLGAVRGSAAALPGPDRIDAYIGTSGVAVDGTVREVSGNTAIVDVGHIAATDLDADAQGGLLVPAASLPPLLPGDVVEVDANTLRYPSRRPGPESEATLERENVVAVATSPLVTLQQQGGPSPSRAVAWMQQRVIGAVNSVLPEPAAALLLGVAFGIRQPLAPTVRTALQDAGLIHIVVVSGLKVVMLLGLVAALSRVLGWSPRRMLLTSLLLVALYVLLSGAGPAAIRSAIMAGAALFARLHGRRLDPLPMLALVAALMLGVDPPLATDPGFQLSFLGTAGILLMAEPLSRRIPGPRILVEPFAVTVAAQAATIPVMAGTFGVIALAGPVANALVLPLLPPLIVAGGGAALIAIVAPWLAWAPLHLAGLVVDVVVFIATALSAVPGAVIQVGNWPGAWSLGEAAGVIAAVTPLVLLHRRTANAAEHGGSRLRAAAAAALCGTVAGGGTALAASQPDSLLHVTVLNVGSAPAVLVESRGTVALIDGGASPAALVEALGRVLPPLDNRIDMVVITGGEQAAVAGLTGLIGHDTVGTVLSTPDLTPGAASVLEQLVTAGANAVSIGNTQWTLGGAAWRCLRYHAQSTDRDDCVIQVMSPSGSVMVLGAAGSADQDELAAMYSGLRADVLVTPPGGALSTALLGTVQPRSIAVPLASGAIPAPAPQGVITTRTGNDGDLAYDGAPSGLQPSA